MMRIIKTINSLDDDIATVASFDKLIVKKYVFYDMSP
jgi:hypothetical protein